MKRKAKTNSESKSVIKTIEHMIDLVAKEVSSPYGKINLFGTILVSLIIVLQLLSGSVEKVATIIANACIGLKTELNEINYVYEILIVAVVFIICLYFMHIANKEEKKISDDSRSKK